MDDGSGGVSDYIDDGDGGHNNKDNNMATTAVVVVNDGGRQRPQITRVVYHGVTSSFFGISILLVSDLLGFQYFGRYHPPLFCILPPFFPQKGGRAP